MKRLAPLFAILLFCISSPLIAQVKFKTKVDLQWSGFECRLPKDWRTDSYSGSSVCDCEGVIFDNFDTELRINVYFTDKAGLADPMRDQVWDYVWEPADAVPYAYTNLNGLKFNGYKGQWKDQADGHQVIRLDAGMNDKHMVRIFIFGPDAEFEAFLPAIPAFLDFVKLKKQKQD